MPEAVSALGIWYKRKSAYSDEDNILFGGN